MIGDFLFLKELIMACRQTIDRATYLLAADITPCCGGTAVSFPAIADGAGNGGVFNLAIELGMYGEAMGDVSPIYGPDCETIGRDNCCIGVSNVVVTLGAFTSATSPCDCDLC